MNSGPKYFRRVLAFAGDSMINRFFGIHTGLSGLEALPYANEQRSYPGAASPNP